MAACSRDEKRFRDALRRVGEVQRQHLLKLLRRNATTQFGQKHGFSSIESVAGYQRQVPVQSYADVAPYIEAIARGENDVLTRDPVRMLQPTSGSTSGTKLIPWTNRVASEFQRAIHPWLASLYRHHPSLMNGTAYWSLSPPATAVRTHGRLRVGFDHDADYLGWFGRMCFPLVNAVPTDVARCSDIGEFRTRTLVSLLADEALSLISVWSPAFLTVLLDDFTGRHEELLGRLAQGTTPGWARRADFIRALLREGRGAVSFERIWPRLRVISCWTHGASASSAANLQRLFPGVPIQGKGLLATEAFVSLPFQEHSDPVLAINSHFFEFQDSTSQEILLAHQLADGKEYQVVVTTGGGLYRYALGDRVLVTGFLHGAPCFRFVGRTGVVSDLFGEKLHEDFVGQVIRRAMESQNIKARFLLLAPWEDAQPGETCYTLFIQAESIPDSAGLSRQLECGLAENFHYQHCRKLGQLAPARIMQIPGSSTSAEAVFLEEMRSRGVQYGNIKPALLDHQTGWERRFKCSPPSQTGHHGGGERGGIA